MNPTEHEQYMSQAQMTHAKAAADAAIDDADIPAIKRQLANIAANRQIQNSHVGVWNNPRIDSISQQKVVPVDSAELDRLRAIAKEAREYKKMVEENILPGQKAAIGAIEDLKAYILALREQLSLASEENTSLISRMNELRQ